MKVADIFVLSKLQSENCINMTRFFHAPCSCLKHRKECRVTTIFSEEKKRLEDDIFWLDCSHCAEDEFMRNKAFIAQSHEFLFPFSVV